MFGVVLWADPVDRKAVIWCEDYGDLAYFKGSLHEGDFPEIDSGDLVQFELRRERSVRLVLNPRLVAEGQFPSLADSLYKPAPVAAPVAVKPDLSGQVVSMAAALRNRITSASSRLPVAG
jgi:hypothetical protein